MRAAREKEDPISVQLSGAEKGDTHVRQPLQLRWRPGRVRVEGQRIEGLQGRGCRPGGEGDEVNMQNSRLPANETHIGSYLKRGQTRSDDEGEG